MFVVDLGFSGAKWLCEERKGTVKTCYRRTRSEDGIPFRGERYLTGSRALLETGSQYLRTLDEMVEMYPLFVAVCAEKAGLVREDVLVVGLPYDFWKSEQIKHKKGQSSVINRLVQELSEIDTDRTYVFEEVMVFPQGLGGIKAYISQAQESPSGNILAVDIGFNTVIYTLYSIEEGEIIAGKTFYKKGIHDLAVNRLLPEIQKHVRGKTLTPLEIDHIMQTGHIQVGFERIDIGPEIREAMDAYVNDLFDLVTGDLKAHGGVVTFDTVLLFGGGARLVKERVASNTVKIVVLDEPEYANALGFRVRAEELMK